MSNAHTTSATLFHEPFDRLTLSNKRVLITGGASGIGEATARMFASNGAHVVIGDNNTELGYELESKLVSSGLSVKFIPVDVTSWKSQVQMFAAAMKWFPEQELDILVTSAGVAADRAWEERPGNLEDLLHYVEAGCEGALKQPGTRCVDVALVGATHSAHIATKYCMGQKRYAKYGAPAQASKAIVFVGSIGAYMPEGSVPYETAVGFGIRGLFQSLRMSAAAESVRFNLLAPYFVDTPLLDSVRGELEEDGVKYAEMEDVVEAVARMSGDVAVAGRAIGIAAGGIKDLCDDGHVLDDLPAFHADGSVTPDDGFESHTPAESRL